MEARAFAVATSTAPPPRRTVATTCTHTSQQTTPTTRHRPQRSQPQRRQLRAARRGAQRRPARARAWAPRRCRLQSHTVTRGWRAPAQLSLRTPSHGLAPHPPPLRLPSSGAKVTRRISAPAHGASPFERAVDAGVDRRNADALWRAHRPPPHDGTLDEHCVEAVRWWKLRRRCGCEVFLRVLRGIA